MVLAIEKAVCVHGYVCRCVIASKHQAGTAGEKDKRLGSQVAMGP